MITIVDYGAGNLRSVENALSSLEVPYVITADAGEVSRAAAILLPGVGHFSQMMCSLDRLNLTHVLRDAIRGGVPYLGICLGMHALFEGSEEAPNVPGLGILRGSIRRFPVGLKVPHMGWNQVKVKSGTRLFGEVSGNLFAYFAHSYYLSVQDAGEAAAATADYGFSFAAAIETRNIRGTQFHPEKSADTGLGLLRNFAAQCTNQ